MQGHLEENRDKVRVGDVVNYSDMSNDMDYVVIGVESEGLTVRGENGQEESHEYKHLQHGWSLPVERKQELEIN